MIRFDFLEPESSLFFFLIQVELPIGAGSLPLMRHNSTLLPDKEHVIPLSPNANATSASMPMSMSTSMEDSMRDEMGSDLT